MYGSHDFGSHTSEFFLIIFFMVHLKSIVYLKYVSQWTMVLILPKRRIRYLENYNLNIKYNDNFLKDIIS
jgi:hypothetical protein